MVSPTRRFYRGFAGPKVSLGYSLGLKGGGWLEMTSARALSRYFANGAFFLKLGKYSAVWE